jgi:hypothetical protein
LRLHRHHGHAGVEYFGEVRDVEIGHADVGDLALVAQPRKLDSRLYIAGHLVVPPMKLHQIQSFYP